MRYKILTWLFYFIVNSRFLVEVVSGLPPQRVLRGSKVPLGKYPFLVGLYEKGLYCGGSIINNSTILTAAHCLDGKKKEGLPIRLRVASGVIRFSEMTSDKRRKVSKIVIHSDYRKKTMDNDIGLVLLSSPIDFNQLEDAIKLPKPQSTPTPDKETYATATVAGWGELENKQYPDEAMEVTLDVISSIRCSEMFTKLRGREFNVSKTVICTYSGSKDACQGDSGGPLFAKDGGDFIQIGIVSWGVGCGEKDTPAVYTRVDQYLDWIRENGSCSMYYKSKVLLLFCLLLPMYL